MNMWKLCGITFFAIAFVLLAVESFFIVVAAYSPVEHVGGIWDVSVSVEIEPFYSVMLFVFSLALIAIGAVCLAKGSRVSRTSNVSHEKQRKDSR